MNENKIKIVCLESEFFGNNLISNSLSNDTEIINENITYENNECVIFESETETNSDRSLNNGHLSDLSILSICQKVNYLLARILCKTIIFVFIY